MNYFILQGGAEHHGWFTHNEQWADYDAFWTVPKSAVIGDIGFVYLLAPLSRIVGKVEIITKPELNIGNVFSNEIMDGKWCAEIKFDASYPHHFDLTLNGMKKLFPDWRWLKMPRGNTRIPEHIIEPFLEMINERTK